MDPVKPVSQMTPEELSAYAASLQQQNPIQTMPATGPIGSPVGPTPVPLPNVQPQAPADQGFLNRIGTMLSNMFLSGTDAKTLAAGAPSAPGSPLELQQQRDKFKQLAPPQ